MSKRRLAPADAPGTLVDPEYRKKLKAKRDAEQARYDQLCGPVVVTKPDSEHPLR